jgi:hypothetical protein
MRAFIIPLAVHCVCIAILLSAADAAPQPAAGPWSIVKHTSAMDDRINVALMTQALSIEGGFTAKPTLMLIGCDKKKEISNMALVLNGGEILETLPVKLPTGFVTGSDVRIRHDKDKPYKWWGRPSTNLLILVGGKKPVKKLAKSTSTLTIEVRFASGSTGVAVFPIDQFNEAEKVINGSCPAR